MGTEKFTETRDYLRLWLERSQKAADAAPTVQQLCEDMDWVVQTLDRRPPEAADIPSLQLDEVAESVFQRVSSELPMIPQVDPTGLNSATSTAVSSTSAVVGYVENVGRLQTPDTERYASESLSEYRQLQDSHQRPEQVRILLAATLPAVGSKFDSARDAYRRCKSGHGTERAAALEMRTFLNGLEGELFERARHRPRENMNPDIVLGRIYSSAPTRAEVKQQFGQKSSLIEALSAMAKRRDSSRVYDLDALWARVLDHAFIIVNALK